MHGSSWGSSSGQQRGLSGSRPNEGCGTPSVLQVLPGWLHFGPSGLVFGRLWLQRKCSWLPFGPSWLHFQPFIPLGPSWLRFFVAFPGLRGSSKCNRGRGGECNGQMPSPSSHYIIYLGSHTVSKFSLCLQAAKEHAMNPTAAASQPLVWQGLWLPHPHPAPITLHPQPRLYQDPWCAWRHCVPAAAAATQSYTPVG